jgi:hypothetical protein
MQNYDPSFGQLKKAEVPDPNGPPVPVADGPSGVGAAMTAITVLACGGVAFVLFGGLTHQSCGATRSAKLQWEQRQALVDQAVDEELARRQTPTNPSAQLAPDGSNE